MKVTLEFSGGAELLVGKIKKHNVELPEKNEWTLEGLLAWVSRYHTNINISFPSALNHICILGEGQYAPRQT